MAFPTTDVHTLCTPRQQSSRRGPRLGQPARPIPFTPAGSQGEFVS